MPKITITLEPSEVHLYPEIMKALESPYVVSDDTPEVEKQAAPVEAEKPRLGTAAALTNDATQPGQSTGSSAAEVMAKVNMKPTKGATDKNGKTIQVDDYVMNGAGEEGVVAATYRGNAVVEFEDGSAELIKASDLEYVPQDDDGTEAPEQQQVSNGKDNSGELELVNNSEATTLRNKANDLISGEKATPPEVFAILADYGAEKFDQLPKHNFKEVSDKLDAMATVAATDNAHGF